MQLLRCVAVPALAALLWLASARPVAAADFPKGTFTLKGPDGAVWGLTFDGKSKFTVMRDGNAVVDGTYKATDDMIDFTDENGPFADKDAGAGTYKWKLDGDKLTFTKTKDKSEGRAQAITGGTWQKK